MKKLKVVAISDTHMFHPRLKLPEGDILIHAGDSCNSGKFQELANFANWFNNQPHKFKCLVYGNHDRFSELDINTAKSLFNFPNTYCLINKGCEIEGIKLWGSPISPEFCGWSWGIERNSQKMKDVWDQIPEGLDILITHGPPHTVMDLVDRGENIGCELLMEAIKLKKPKIHIFGHRHLWLHENKIEKRGETTFINAAICDDNYKPVNPPIVFDIEI